MRRCALFIGVNDYGFAPLSSCVNDAVALRDTVVRIGLVDAAECTLMTSPAVPGSAAIPTRRAILDWLLDHYEAAAPLDRLLVFFAGHGLSVRLGRAADELQTVLVPAGVHALKHIGGELIDLDELLGRFARRGAREQFWIIDACRNLPPDGVVPNVAPIPWDLPQPGDPRDAFDMAQAALFAVAPLGQARAVSGGHGLLTGCVLDGLGFTGAARWGAASYYDEGDGSWRVDLASLCDYAAAQIGADIPKTSWEREYQLPRAWTSEKLPGALHRIDELPRRPFVVRVDPPAASAAVKVWLSVKSIPVAEWPPRPPGEPVALPPERYRLSAELVPGAAGWTLPPLPERVVDVRARDEICVRVLPAGGVVGGAIPPRSQTAPPVVRQSTGDTPRATALESVELGGRAPHASVTVHAADLGASVRLTRLSGGRGQRDVTVDHRTNLEPGLWRVEVLIGNDVIAVHEEDLVAGQHYDVSPMAQVTPAAAALMAGEPDVPRPTVAPSETIGPMQGAILPTLLPLLALRPFDTEGVVLQRMAGQLAIPLVPVVTAAPAALALALDGAWGSPWLPPGVGGGMPDAGAAIVNLGGEAARVWVGAGSRIALFVRARDRAWDGARLVLPGVGELDAAAPRLAGYCATLAVTLWPDHRCDVSISLMRMPPGADQMVRPGKLSRALAIASRLSAANASLDGIDPQVLGLISTGSWGDPVLGAMAWFGGARALASHRLEDHQRAEITARQAAIAGFLQREVAALPDARVIAALGAPAPDAALDALLADAALEQPVLADAVVALARRAIARGTPEHPAAQRYQHLARDAVFNVIWRRDGG